MKSLFIPEHGPVKVVEVDTDEDADTLSQLQRLVGGFIEVFTFDPETRMVINEEGKLEGLGVNVRAHSLVAHMLRADDTIVGPAVLTGIDPRTGQMGEISPRWIEFAETYFEMEGE